MPPPASSYASLMSFDPFIFLSNRGSRNFAAALEPLGGREYVEGDSIIDLLYFDSFGGKQAPTGVEIGFELIDRQRTIPLDNKSQMAALLCHAGLTFPRVYFEPEQMPHEPGTLWFIKNPRLASGKGMQVVKWEHVDEQFEPGCIIQEAVQDVMLIDDRKFTLRVYTLVHDGKLYLYPTGIAVIHALSYDPDSLDPRVQFLHDGYMKKDSPVEMIAFNEVSQYQQVFSGLPRYLAELFSVFADLLKFEGEQRYCLFGLDLLVREDLSCVMVEINDRPNLVHTSFINQAINIPMLRAMYCVLDPQRTELLERNSPQFGPVAEL